MTSADRQAARSGANAVISVLGLSAQQMAGFVITLLAAGFLSAAEYGVYTLAVVFVEFVVMLTYTGFFHFVVVSDAAEDAVLDTMFWVMLGIGTAGGALMALCAGPIAAFFDVPELAPILILFGCLQPFASAISWGAAVLTRGGQMRQYFVILIAANGFALVAGAAVLILWQSLYALVLYRAVRLVFSLLLFGMAVPRLPRVRFDLALFRSAWRYAVGLYGARMLSFFSTFGTDLILAYLFTTAESGLYRFANRLAMSTVDIIAQPLRSFALKSFGRAARMQAPLTPLFAAYFTGTLFLTGGFALTVFFLGEAMTRALFQPEYLLALGAIHALALRALARAGQSMIEPTFAATKDTRVAFHNNLMLAAALLVVTLLAAPYGFVRVAWAQALVQLAFVPLSLWIIARWSPVDVIPCLRHSLRALVLLGCYAAALWLVGAVLQPLEMNAAAKLLFGMMAAVTVGAVLSLVAYLDGILKPQIFAD